MNNEDKILEVLSRLAYTREILTKHMTFRKEDIKIIQVIKKLDEAINLLMDETED